MSTRLPRTPRCVVPKVFNGSIEWMTITHLRSNSEQSARIESNLFSARHVALISIFISGLSGTCRVSGAIVYRPDSTKRQQNVQQMKM